MLRVYPPPNANNTATARSREAPCRLSAPSLSCLFSGIFFIVQQVGHIPQADAQGGPVVQQCRGGRWQYPRHAQRNQRQIEAHDEAVDNYPLNGGKGMPYEGGSRVPLIIRWTGKIFI